MRNIEIDEASGFCFGVVTAIRKAEEELDKSGHLYCLGDIVHNAAEVERLRRKGLVTITHADLESLHDVKVLLRAHGEPPATYAVARRNNIEIIDATCPVVLQLQRRIKMAADAGAPAAEPDSASEAADANTPREPLILIYGKPGHAEVNGLVGQTDGRAIVIRDMADLDSVDLSRDIRLYSQTTKSLDGFRHIVAEIERRKQQCGGAFEWFDTICRQVASRMEGIRKFAEAHDVVIFVSGTKSSNGKVLFAECCSVNPRSYMVSGPAELQPQWTEGAASIGICGATSTPAWLMKEVADALREQ
ncbi:MAG: 4-hydroxy-3-methylbut-2-enyl diphosphate reductase [Muribaculaceae bacterium]|nr:4-hydroxy-3-methylbut-2-enyl diphosphate reductase [Muribaculaceae bacterium]MDE7081678.1 4-hydroxy-3-methylbut-2-enyl diphosphate reductase [Muribaculaceae bacterium]